MHAQDMMKSFSWNENGTIKPVVQGVEASLALTALDAGLFRSIMWEATPEQIARNERMFPESRTCYVTCKHPAEQAKAEYHKFIVNHAPGERFGIRGEQF